MRRNVAAGCGIAFAVSLMALYVLGINWAGAFWLTLCYLAAGVWVTALFRTGGLRIVRTQAVYLALPFFGILIEYINFGWSGWDHELFQLFYWFVASMVFSGLNLMIRARGGKTTRKTVAVMLGFVALTPVIVACAFRWEALFRIIYGQPISNFQELWLVLAGFREAVLRLLFLAVTVLVLLIWLAPATRARMTGRGFFGVAAGTLVAAFLTVWFWGDTNLSRALVREKGARVWVEAYELHRKLTPASLIAGEFENRGRDGLFFLVIGESQNGDQYHELAKKYPLFLSEQLKSKEWLDFPRAYSYFNPAAGLPPSDYSARHLLSVLQYDQTPRKSTGPICIFDIARACGYQSLWLSSQKCFLPLLPNIDAFSRVADRVCWIKAKWSDDEADPDNMVIDRLLAGELRRALLEGNFGNRTLVVIKMMGSHLGHTDPPAELRNRYPQLDEYELSLICFDETFRTLAGEITAYPQYAGMVYLTDHTRLAENDVPIPLLVHLPERTRRENPQMAARLEKAAAGEILSSNVFDLMLDLMGIVPRMGSTKEKELKP